MDLRTVRSCQKFKPHNFQQKHAHGTNSIIKLRRTEPDTVEYALELLKSYAISSMFYCAEVRPTNTSALDIIETQHSKLWKVWKAILQVPQSSAREIALTDLGLKPICLSLEERIFSLFLTGNFYSFFIIFIKGLSNMNINIFILIKEIQINNFLARVISGGVLCNFYRLLEKCDTISLQFPISL